MLLLLDVDVFDVDSLQGGKEDFPFRMEVNSLKGKEILGFVNWPTLGNAKTKMRGKIEGNRCVTATATTATTLTPTTAITVITGITAATLTPKQQQQQQHW